MGEGNLTGLAGGISHSPAAKLSWAPAGDRALFPCPDTPGFSQILYPSRAAPESASVVMWGA